MRTREQQLFVGGWCLAKPLLRHIFMVVTTSILCLFNGCRNFFGTCFFFTRSANNEPWKDFYSLLESVAVMSYCRTEGDRWEWSAITRQGGLVVYPV